MTEYYLWILQFMGIANPRSVKLLERFGSAEAVYRLFENNDLRFLKPNEEKLLKTASLEKSREIIKLCEKKNCCIITIDDSDYPVPLKNIYNPPIVLFVLGTLPKDELCITVIGTREPCDYSYKVTEQICKPLAKNGVIIISGMARGIDKAAHTAAVEVGGRTVGILACGINIDYPKNSTPFREQIISLGGAVVSELLPDQNGGRNYFSQRNRIMSGFSRGTLIVEADYKSGCHLTAAHAYNQNRDIFCIPPGDILNTRFGGVISYLRDGAVAVFDYTDILNEYLISPVIADAEESKKASLLNKDFLRHKTVNIIPQCPPLPDLSRLPPERLAIVNILTKGTKTIDELLEKSGLDAADISGILLDMEIDGIIESAAGASYKLSEFNRV